MKKLFILLVSAFMYLCASAQTEVRICPNDEAGYVERYVVVDEINSFDTIVDIIENDSVIVQDTVTLYDTTYMEGFYNYRAFANEGYVFNSWTVTMYMNLFPIITDDTVIFVDSIYTIELMQMNIEVEGEDTIDYDGWLDFDMGIPDLSEYPLEGYDSIIIVANFVTEGVAVKEAEEETFRVFPNPTSDMLNIQGDFDNLIIYNQLGQQVIKTNKNVINVSNQADGIYFIQVYRNNKLIKVLPVAKINTKKI